MFTHALPQGSLRPVEALPPTLTPNAIFAMAPPAPRRLSFLGACVVYASCGLAMTFAPTLQTKFDARPTARVIFNDPTESVQAPAVVQQTPPTPRPGLVLKSAPARPEGWTPPLDSNLVPATPDTFPTKDDSMRNARAATPEDALRPTTAVLFQGPSTRTSAPEVVNFDFHQMQVLSAVNPTYPPIARLAKIQGEVVLLMTVDPYGIPAEVKALTGPHPSLEQEAMRVARLWRFEPARMNGQAVSAQFRLTIQFRLR